MTSRDGSNRFKQQPGNNPARQQSSDGFGLDADELDRYMSGQPSKQPRFDPYGRSQTTGQTRSARTTAPQIQPQYDDYADAAEAWDEPDYDDSYPSEDAYAQPIQSASARRHLVQEHEDDLYEDPYVMDDEEINERPQPRQQRPQRRRPQRQSNGLTLPPVIAEAPLVRDRMALGILGAGALSLLLMIIVVAANRDGLGSLIPTHVNADGGVQTIEESSAVWRMPLIAAMMTLISGVIAWFLAKWGTFLPRFLLGGCLAVQFVVWVGVFAYLIK